MFKFAFALILRIAVVASMVILLGGTISTVILADPPGYCIGMCDPVEFWVDEHSTCEAVYYAGEGGGVGPDECKGDCSPEMLWEGGCEDNQEPTCVKCTNQNVNANIPEYEGECPLELDCDCLNVVLGFTPTPVTTCVTTQCVDCLP